MEVVFQDQAGCDKWEDGYRLQNVRKMHATCLLMLTLARFFAVCRNSGEKEKGRG